jgi:hypothetical protein
MQQFIDRQVARTNRALVVTGIVLLAIVGVAGWASAGYYTSYFTGPRPTTLDEVAAARSVVPERAYVSLQGELLETGYGEITTTEDKYTHKKKSEKVTASYLAITDGPHTLLIKAPSDTKGSSISGWLRAPEGLDSAVIANLRRDDREAAAALLPLVLDATADFTGGAIGLVALAALLVLCAVVLRRWSSRRTRPEGHPIWKRLAALGNARSLAAEIDMEARASDVARFKGGVSLTRSWLLRERTYGFDTIPVERLAWIHKKVTTQKQYFITVGKQFDAVICDRDGVELTVRAKQEEVDRLLTSLQERVPWVLAGWTQELENAWKQQRAQVVAAVDARRAQQRRPASGSEG